MGRQLIMGCLSWATIMRLFTLQIDTDRDAVNGKSVSAAAVAVPIVVVVLFLVIIATIGILIGYYKSKD